MNFWMLKTDPSEYSFQQLLRAHKIPWEGVVHPRSLRHLAAMRKCDQALVYHTGSERAFVGSVRIASNPYPDISNDDVRLLVVDVDMPVALSRAVTLAAVKNDARFAVLPLRNSQLVVLPVPEDLFTTVLELGASV